MVGPGAPVPPRAHDPRLKRSRPSCLSSSGEETLPVNPLPHFPILQVPDVVEGGWVPSPLAEGPGPGFFWSTY